MPLQASSRVLTETPGKPPMNRWYGWGWRMPPICGKPPSGRHSPPCGAITPGRCWHCLCRKIQTRFWAGCSRPTTAGCWERQTTCLPRSGKSWTLWNFPATWTAPPWKIGPELCWKPLSALSPVTTSQKITRRKNVCAALNSSAAKRERENCLPYGPLATATPSICRRTAAGRWRNSTPPSTGRDLR